jgi:hypothetical protein
MKCSAGTTDQNSFRNRVGGNGSAPVQAPPDFIAFMNRVSYLVGGGSLYRRLPAIVPRQTEAVLAGFFMRDHRGLIGLAFS